MPYITKEKRILVDHANVATDCGELNYLLTKFCLEYLERKGIKYQTFNDILGALEGCKLEFYRRQVSSYEEQKIKINGDL